MEPVEVVRAPDQDASEPAGEICFGSPPRGLGDCCWKEGFLDFSPRPGASVTCLQVVQDGDEEK